MDGLTHISNATKANLIALVNAVILCLQAFGLQINNAQQAAIGAVVNAALVSWIGLTFKSSRDGSAETPRAAGAPTTGA